MEMTRAAHFKHLYSLRAGLERFPIDETIRLLTEPIKHFIWENFSRTEWRNKNVKGQIRTVHLRFESVI